MTKEQRIAASRDGLIVEIDDAVDGFLETRHEILMDGTSPQQHIASIVEVIERSVTQLREIRTELDQRQHVSFSRLALFEERMWSVVGELEDKLERFRETGCSTLAS